MISMSLCREDIYPEFPESSGRAPESPHGTGSDCARGRRWHWGSKVLCCSEPICELPIANATWLIRCGIRWEIIPVLIIESYDPFLITLVLWPTMALVSTNAVPAGGAWTLLFEQCPNNHMPLSWSFSLDTFGWLNSIELPIFNIPPESSSRIPLPSWPRIKLHRAVGRWRGRSLWVPCRRTSPKMSWEKSLNPMAR